VGIRFKCHTCGHELHVKDFLAGKRSKCPACSIRFRIPQESADFSVPLADSSESDLSASGDSTVVTATKTSSASVANSQLASISAVPTPSINSPSTTSKPTPRAIQEAPDAAWFVQPPSGGQFGPAPSPIFAEWLGENRITRDSMVWREGWPKWQLASEVFADYFPPPIAGSQATAPKAPPATAAPQVAVTPGSIPSTASSDKMELDTGASALTTVERTRLAKKMKRRRNYTLMILLLAMVAIGLVVALVVVLMRK
jgi:GYF domain 2